MRLTELKKMIRQASREDLENTITELYKRYSPEQKKDIDSVLVPLLLPELQNDSMLEEIGDFIDDVYSGRYWNDNVKITKAEQKKWPLKLRSYLDYLDNLKEDDDDFDEGMDLYWELLELIKRASLGKYFHAQDFLKTLERDPSQIFHSLLTKEVGFATGQWEMNILMRHVLQALDPVWGNQQTMEDHFLSQLTSRQKELSLQSVINYMDQTAESGSTKKQYRKNTEAACELALKLNIALGRRKEGVMTFWENYPYYANYPSVKLNQLLRMLPTKTSEDQLFWCQVYERASRDGLELYNSEKEKYEEFRAEKQNLDSPSSS